jgi:hypothetical protein
MATSLGSTEKGKEMVMFRKTSFGLLVGALVSLTAAVSTAGVVTLQPVDDAHINSQQPDYPFGNDPAHIPVLEQFGYVGGPIRPLFMFDLSSIPDDATLLSAQLTLQLAGIYGGYLHPTTAWRMPNDNWVEETVTWNSYDQTGAVSVAILPPATQLGSRVWNITIADWTYAEDLLDNAVTFMTRFDDSSYGHETDGYYKANSYSSMEGPVAPTLMIEYVVPEPSTMALALLGLAGLSVLFRRSGKGVS